jgi:hypothetical protein
MNEYTYLMVVAGFGLLLGLPSVILAYRQRAAYRRQLQQQLHDHTLSPVQRVVHDLMLLPASDGYTLYQDGDQHDLVIHTNSWLPLAQWRLHRRVQRRLVQLQATALFRSVRIAAAR